MSCLTKQTYPVWQNIHVQSDKTNISSLTNIHVQSDKTNISSLTKYICSVWQNRNQNRTNISITLMTTPHVFPSLNLQYPLRLLTTISSEKTILNKILLLHFYNYAKLKVLESFEINSSIQQLKFTCLQATKVWKSTFSWPKFTCHRWWIWES